MFYDIQEKIKNCKICIMVNSGNRKKGNLGKRQFPKKPRDLVSIDFVVDLPITNNRNIHLLTVVDNFTKYLKVYAIRDRTAKTAARCIYTISLYVLVCH